MINFHHAKARTLFAAKRRIHCLPLYFAPGFAQADNALSTGTARCQVEKRQACHKEAGAESVYT